jgi:aminopeptidase N
MARMPSLTRAEAAERARLLSVSRYTVDLDLTKGEDVFGCTTTVRFDSTESGASTFIELKPAALHRAVLNGRELDPAALSDGRLELTGLAAANELLIEADMAYSRTGEGVHRFTDPVDGSTYLYSQSAADDAQRVFPCFDQPDLKAVLEFTATAPAEWTVIGNGIGTRTEDGRWEFAPTPKLSTYLFVVVAGPYHSLRREHAGKPFGLHCRASLAEHLDKDADELFELTFACYDRYHELFTEPYPFDSYDQAFVPEFNFGAMENPGCVTFRDDFIYRSAVTDDQRLTRGMVISHEMAHMWFGDLVTMQWWDDLWLNESFAEFMGYQVLSESTRFTGTWTQFAAGRKAWGYDADQRPSTHPVAPEQVNDVAQALGNFDGISYAKGASALRQLVHWLGRDAFLAGINDHFARHKFGNATLADFLGSLDRASGDDRDVNAWAERWLSTTGVDTLAGSTAELPDGKGWTVEVERKSGNRPHRLNVALHHRTDDGGPDAGTRIDLDLDADADTASVSVPAGPRPALVLPNSGDYAYTKIRLDAASWQTVTESLAALPEAIDRAVIWNAARDMVRDAELPASDYLDLAARHLPAETDTAIVEHVLGFSRQAADRYLDPADRPAGLARINSICRTYLDTATDPDLRLAAARGFAATVQGKHDADLLRGWLTEGTVPGPLTGGPGGPAMDPELRWKALLRLSILGEAGETEIAAEAERDPSATGREGAARCRAARPDAAAKEAAWQSMFHDDELSNYLLTATAEGFWQPEQRELTAAASGTRGSYAERFFTEAPATAARRGAAIGMVLGRYAFPAFAVEQSTVEAGERCLAEGGTGAGMPAVLRRALADQLDDLQRALSSRTAHTS